MIKDSDVSSCHTVNASLTWDKQHGAHMLTARQILLTHADPVQLLSSWGSDNATVARAFGPPAILQHAPRAHIHNRLWRARAAARCGSLWEYGLTLYIINPKSQSRIGLQSRFVVYSHSVLILHPNQIKSSTHITSAIVIMWWFRVPSTTMTTKNI